MTLSKEDFIKVAQKQEIVLGIVASNKALYAKNGNDFDFGRQIYQNLNEIKEVQKNKKKILNSNISFISGDSRPKNTKEANSSLLDRSNSKVHPANMKSLEKVEEA